MSRTCRHIPEAAHSNPRELVLREPLRVGVLSLLLGGTGTSPRQPRARPQHPHRWHATRRAAENYVPA